MNLLAQICDRIPVFLFVLLISIQVSAQEQSTLRFTNINLEDGLGDDWCHDALMDRFGYMWFATQDGLSKFDGIRFINFRFDEEDPNSLGGNIVMELMEGNDGLWIASNGGGLNFFNPETEQFTRYQHDPDDPSSISGNTTVSLFQDSDSIIWVGTYDRGFNRLDPKTGRFTPYTISEEDRMLDAFRYNSVLEILEDKKDSDYLWLGTNNGLYNFNKKTEQLRLVSSPEIDGKRLNCHKIHYGKPGKLWVAVAGAGICSFDIQQEKWTIFPSEPGFWEKGNPHGNLIFDMERKSESEWWVAHRNSGLGIFDESTGTYNYIKSDPANPYSVISNEGFGIYKDPENRLWFFSFQRGISFLDPAYQTLQFNPIQSQVCTPRTTNEVKAFAKDKTGKLYIVTNSCEGLYILGEDQQVIDWAPNIENPNVYQDFIDVLVDSREWVWVLSNNEGGGAGLLRYNAATGYCEPFDLSPYTALPVQSFQLTDILEDWEHNLWLATNFNGLIKIDFEKDTVLQYLASAKNPMLLNDKLEISELKLDSKGNIWIATLTEGAYVFDPEKSSFRNYGYQENGAKLLPDTKVLTLEEDYLGYIWIGMNTQGIQILDPKKEGNPIIGSKRRKDGLPAEQISKIRRDSSGNMWVTTNKGLSKYDIKEKNFSSFGKKEGLNIISSVEKGLEIGPDGTLFFGQSWGYFNFHPDSVYINETPPKVRLTFFKVYEKERKFEKNINFLNEVRLKHFENFFSIGFSCLNYSASEKNRYSYQLVGIDKDWVYPVEGQSVAYYTTVDPGSYTFRVRAANNNGIWNDVGHSLRIIITPPFWQTMWFYGICAILVFSLVYGYYQWRLRTIRDRARIETQLAELELKALRAQMNPHFIFNSLNAIKLLIQAERKNEAGDYLTKFSKMIRGVLHYSDRKRISLREELEISKLFLTMEELRFQKKFDYSIDVKDDLNPDLINVPPLIFQPYLENAIWHGLMHLEEEGSVSLSIERRNGHIQCIIEDNGIGREMAAKINSKRRSRHKSVGISITQERLRLTKKLDNTQMGVEIIDKKDNKGKATGTKVVINLN